MEEIAEEKTEGKLEELMQQFEEHARDRFEDYKEHADEYDLDNPSPEELARCAVIGADLDVRGAETELDREEARRRNELINSYPGVWEFHTIKVEERLVEKMSEEEIEEIEEKLKWVNQEYVQDDLYTDEAAEITVSGTTWLDLPSLALFADEIGREVEGKESIEDLRDRGAEWLEKGAFVRNLNDKLPELELEEITEKAKKALIKRAKWNERQEQEAAQ